MTVETDLVTLSRHVIHEQSHHKEASGDLTLLLMSIQVATKVISTNVRKAGIVNLYRQYANALEPELLQERKKTFKLDIISNEVFINCISSSGKVSIMVSEENQDAIIVSSSGTAKYAVVFDPLDGSSNIDAGVSIGSIFGIYRLGSTNSHSISEVLRTGSEMIAAGYAMYGSYTSLVITIGGVGGNVHGYTLDNSIGEYILTHPNIKIPPKGSIYSVNEGNSAFWDASTKRYFEKLKTLDKPYSSRYVGSMVADVHRTLLYGGIFAYPADSKSKSGKLRLLYECFPMAMICENAGGRATTGKKRILDIIPTSLHARAPIVLGSIEDVLEYEYELQNGQ
ncbi:hypothetical protein DI09_170p50 [Mitosporidium daphniae]|uniref:Fructose-1,6-bisphosphatase n=1 Tax=Mitosporidium daphniae TaxID=1485682 RepID=A0A098VXI6_9MICR|nr:uncharacterized protein DI09_170p50 [Mitosporidium daphniae]KGG52446.1 hypothetical protein DI09_170p50 [Mitosporidium daphniae]|eukprot:XP_013238882.1 uncharacterized protein DI09_170p50 [Mitosporidium daphniae]